MRTMHSIRTRAFLQDKIMDLQQALFFSESSAVLKLPTSIISALCVDDVDQVWFFVKRPGQFVNEFDREFRAKLEFYKKGKNFYLHLSGKACMVTDPEEINNVFGLSHEQKIQAQSEMVLVKFRITEIQFYPLQVLRPALPQGTKINFQPLAFIKTLQYIVKDIIPVFQSH